MVRLGIPVKKSMGNAVIRNRIKRLHRESIRCCAVNYTGGFDAVILPFKDARIGSFQEINKWIQNFFLFLKSRGFLSLKKF